MNKLKNYRRLLALLLIGLLIYSCSEDVNDTLTSESDQNFISEKFVKDVSNNFLFKNEKYNSLKKLKVTYTNKSVKELVPIKNEKSETVFYIINYNGGGFVMLAADNRTLPILAYSETNNFSLNEESYPSGLVKWLTDTKKGIELVREKNIVQTKSQQLAWENLNYQNKLHPDDEFGGGDEPNCEDDYEEVGPLLSTRWHQQCGFNDLMPTLNCSNIPCGRAFAGCVPIAIAQVMRYHEFPTNYNWSNMPNNSGSVVTSQLIGDIHNTIGSVNYDCDATGVSHDYNVANVFTNGFGYATANQGDYNRETVKQYLRWNKPVILSGGRDDGWWIFHDYTDGHMWVCDGFRRHFIWSEDCSTGSGYLFFHMNWGWGGQNNDWYAFNDFTPGNFTFNYDVKMIYTISSYNMKP